MIFFVFCSVDRRASTELPASPQPGAKHNTHHATGGDGKQEQGEMYSIGRIVPGHIIEICSKEGELQGPKDEEKASQVHRSIQIQTHFEVLLFLHALAQHGQQTNQVGEDREDQDEAHRLPSRGDRDTVNLAYPLLKVGIGEGEEPEDQQVTKQTEDSEARKANPFEPRLSLGSRERLGSLMLNGRAF